MFCRQSDPFEGTAVEEFAEDYGSDGAEGAEVGLVSLRDRLLLTCCDAAGRTAKGANCVGSECGRFSHVREFLASRG